MKCPARGAKTWRLRLFDGKAHGGKWTETPWVRMALPLCKGVSLLFSTQKTVSTALGASDIYLFLSALLST